MSYAKINPKKIPVYSSQEASFSYFAHILINHYMIGEDKSRILNAIARAIGYKQYSSLVNEAKKNAKGDANQPINLLGIATFAPYFIEHIRQEFGDSFADGLPAMIGENIEIMADGSKVDGFSLLKRFSNNKYIGYYSGSDEKLLLEIHHLYQLGYDIKADFRKLRDWKGIAIRPSKNIYGKYFWWIKNTFLTEQEKANSNVIKAEIEAGIIESFNENGFIFNCKKYGPLNLNLLICNVGSDGICVPEDYFIQESIQTVKRFPLALTAIMKLGIKYN